MIQAIRPAWRSLEARAAAWALRRQPRNPRQVQLGYRAVYILPTPFGLLYAAFCVVMLIIALHYNNSMVFAFDFLLVGLGLNAMGFTHRNLLNLHVGFESSEPVFAGDEARFRLRVTNPGRLARRALELQWSDGPVARFALAPGEVSSITLAVPAPRRGRLRPGRFVLRTEYPLGLFRAWSWIELDMETLVWPAPWPQPPERPPTGRDAAGEGGKQRQGDDDFAGIRPYRRGDAMHRMAWKAMAHLQQPHTKEFAAAAGPGVWIDWDDVPPCPVEERLSRLCAEVLEAAAAGLRFGLRLPDRAVEPQSGPAQRDRCLQALALYGTEPA
jgi:uncharacterized protein (DUF58 family)